MHPVKVEDAFREKEKDFFNGECASASFVIYVCLAQKNTWNAVDIFGKYGFKEEHSIVKSVRGSSWFKPVFH